MGRGQDSNFDKYWNQSQRLHIVEYPHLKSDTNEKSMSLKFLLTLLAVVVVSAAPSAPVLDQHPVDKATDNVKDPVQEPIQPTEPKLPVEARQFPLEDGEELVEETAIVTCEYHGQYIRHPTNCAKFFKCSWGEAYEFDCPSDLLFNTNLNVCDWPQNVDCNNDKNCIRRRFGGMSTGDDDAESMAKCVVGHVVIDCQCHDPRNCDGAEVRDNRRCVAVNSHGAGGQRAIAICVAASVDEYVYASSGGRERNPQVRCPNGYRMINCLVRHPWNHVKYVYATRQPNMNRCESDVTCSISSGCNLQAICKRQTSQNTDEDDE